MELVGFLLQVYSLIVLASVILSWVPLSDDNPLVRFTRAATEPVLRPIRRVLPSFGGFDFSAMVLLFALMFLRGFIMQTR